MMGSRPPVAAVSGGQPAQFTFALADEFLHHVQVHGPHLVIAVARGRSSLRTGSASDAMSGRLPRASPESAFAGESSAVVRWHEGATRGPAGCRAREAG